MRSSVMNFCQIKKDFTCIFATTRYLDWRCKKYFINIYKTVEKLRYSVLLTTSIKSLVKQRASIQKTRHTNRFQSQKSQPIVSSNTYHLQLITLLSTQHPKKTITISHPKTPTTQHTCIPSTQTGNNPMYVEMV